MSISTKAGDAGRTGLLYGQRVSKDHPQVEALGALDELNVEIGGARQSSTDVSARELLLFVQASLISLMGEVACAESDAGKYACSSFTRIQESDLGRLDSFLLALEAKGIKMEGWATPGATSEALGFDRARVAARRAERRIISLEGIGRHVRPVVLQWLNRLSDVLWLLARDAESK